MTPRLSLRRPFELGRGYNGDGELGDGTSDTNRLIPVPVTWL